MQRVVERNRVASGTILVWIVSIAILFQQITSAMCAVCLLHQLGLPVGGCCRVQYTNTSQSAQRIFVKQGSCCESTNLGPLTHHPTNCCSGSAEEGSSSSRCACIKDGVTRAVASPTSVLLTSIAECIPFIQLATVYASPLTLVSLRAIRNLDLPPPSHPRYIRFHCLLI